MTLNEAFSVLGLTGLVSQKDIKLAYKRKAQKYHPDKNPAGVELMKMINVAYEQVKALDNVDIAENDDLIASYPDELSEAINAIITLNLCIEICGLWVWVSGDTKPHKEALKAAGFRWASKKKVWYYRPDKASRRFFKKSNDEWSIDKIRETYGSSTARNRQNVYLGNG